MAISKETQEALDALASEFNTKLEVANSAITTLSARIEELSTSVDSKISDASTGISNDLKTLLGDDIHEIKNAAADVKNMKQTVVDLDTKISNIETGKPNVAATVAEVVSHEVPKQTFKSSAGSEGKERKYRFLVPVIRLKNSSSPLTALAALEDQEVLDQIVRLGSGIIEEVVA